MNMSTVLNDVRQRLSRCDIYQVARDLEMAPNTLRYIASGRTANPGVNTIDKIAAYFRNRKEKAS